MKLIAALPVDLNRRVELDQVLVWSPTSANSFSSKTTPKRKCGSSPWLRATGTEAAQSLGVELSRRRLLPLGELKQWLRLAVDQNPRDAKTRYLLATAFLTAGK